ncbi:MAG: hypothetical protein AAFV90_20435 [Cyanobacteria bacterium J06634_5]
MNQRLVDSVAQIISDMSDEERQLLEEKVRLAERSQRPVEEAKTFKIAEIAQDIQSFEKRYNSAPRPSEHCLIGKNSTSDVDSLEEFLLNNSFL